MSGRSTKARVTYLGNNSVTITAPYLKEFVDQLKLVVPPGSREFEWAAKRWTIAEPYVEVAVVLVRGYYADVVVIGRPAAPPPRRQTPQTWAQALFEATPPRLHKAIYKSLAKVLHPDAGGDARAAQQLNDARREDG